MPRSDVCRALIDFWERIRDYKTSVATYEDPLRGCLGCQDLESCPQCKLSRNGDRDDYRCFDPLLYTHIKNNRVCLRKNNQNCFTNVVSSPKIQGQISWAISGGDWSYLPSFRPHSSPSGTVGSLCSQHRRPLELDLQEGSAFFSSIKSRSSKTGQRRRNSKEPATGYPQSGM